MATDAPSVRPTVDRAWLEAAAALDPVAHAYALYDLERFPDRVRFVSALRGETTVGYLLVWLGRSFPVVHWVGAEREASRLVDLVPPRPLAAIVPESVRADVERARGPARAYPVEILAAAPRDMASDRSPSDRARRLGPDDRSRLLALVGDPPELTIANYPSLDLGQEVVWGVFDDDRLAGVARAAVTLPSVWIVSGVFVDPERRGRGLGHALMRAVTADARDARATVALYVRGDRPAARAIYERAGFRPYGRRVWLDAGVGVEP